MNCANCKSELIETNIHCFTLCETYEFDLCCECMTINFIEVKTKQVMRINDTNLSAKEKLSWYVFEAKFRGIAIPKRDTLQ